MAIKVAGQEVISDERKITGAIGLDLTPIEATIADSAVDVFVYDTRKDSDGGAWRKRTQHTSWYNETLNTATRGSRKEFPAVAVIVAESNKVTIYDGDDPDLPMWMEASFASYQAVTSTNSSIVMLNGQMTIGGGINGLGFLNFIKDQGTFIWAGGHKYVSTNIANRNVPQSGWGATVSSSVIVNSTVNDVAMTVLPNAPIDPATGLPIPTIAVATDGGVSVIKDDGSVVDITNTKATTIALADTGVVTVFDTGAAEGVYRHEIPSADQAGFTPALMVYNNSNWSGAFQWSSLDMINTKRPVIQGDYINLGMGQGLVKTINTAIANTPDTNLQAVISSTYNTGWMNGDIKLATLSDTDDTDVTGSELALTTSIGTLGAYASSGVMPSDLVEGQTYVIDIEVTSYTSGGLALWKSGVSYSTIGATSVGTFATTYVHSVDGMQIVGNDSSGFVGTATVSVRLAEEDRSVNGNGLQVFGTVTKNPVATGADLVAYSGFANGANYLKQPNNSDLELNGDFSWSFWVKDNVTVNDYYFEYGDSARTSTPYAILASSTNISAVTANSGSVSTSWSSRGLGIWTHISVVHSNNLLSLYINGKLANTDTTSGDITYNGQEELWIGLAAGATSSAGGASLALLRISATAPTAEQIAKIYEDEKVLFQEGAQATLYGSSDAVTALAYDDTTDLLHVGTSAGRSDFSGLRRVNNTTTAVTTAISASNSLIVEQ